MTPPSPGRPAPLDRSVIGMCTIFMVVGVAIAGGGASWAASTAALVRRATVGTGTVIEFSRTPFESVYYPVVRYRLPSGKVRVFRNGAGGSSRGYAVGAEVQVLHDPEHRTADRIRSFGDLWGGPVALLGLGIMFAAMGLGFLAAERRGPPTGERRA